MKYIKIVAKYRAKYFLNNKTNDRYLDDYVYRKFIKKNVLNGEKIITSAYDSNKIIGFVDKIKIGIFGKITYYCVINEPFKNLFLKYNNYLTVSTYYTYTYNFDVHFKGFKMEIINYPNDKIKELSNKYFEDVPPFGIRQFLFTIYCSL